MHEDYHDLGFEVVYLSIDKNNKFWESVVEKYHIAIPNRSFVVMNLEESEFLNKLNVDLIPRYLIFDKEGKLIHQNAPKPDSKELRVLLESLLFN
ncbi:redoxin [Nitritalea halalkaliphila LW7]|uniref:Redoxin n=1 Tax=Nitritalea halalkaliphila LW7 TaxID=1189621 RepID=I5C1U1_9BACT|nr:redoxin [Nitritalea halalkaliphila LW7]